MSVNSVSNYNHAHRTHAARTQESASQQELAPRISEVSKERKDTFERTNLNWTPGSGPSAEEMKAFNESLAKFRAEHANSEPVEKKETYIIQYEKTAAAVSEQEAKTPVTNSEKIEAEIRALRGQPVTPELEARFQELVGLRASEALKERGIKVNTGDTPEERADYEARLNAAINGTSSANASTTPTPAQNFTTDAVDFLTDAASKLLTADEGVAFSELGIGSGDFVKKMLEAFALGEHSSDEITTLMSQSEDLIREFAKQISDGKEPDIYSLSTELTINGANTTIGQLLNN